MNQKTHEQWIKDNDVALLSLLSSFPISSERLLDFVRSALALVPFSSVSEHHAVLEFKAVDSELEEKISLPLNEWQLEWIAGYYERNSELLRLACIELVESLDNANERKL